MVARKATALWLATLVALGISGGAIGQTTDAGDGNIGVSTCNVAEATAAGTLKPQLSNQEVLANRLDYAYLECDDVRDQWQFGIKTTFSNSDYNDRDESIIDDNYDDPDDGSGSVANSWPGGTFPSGTTYGDYHIWSQHYQKAWWNPGSWGLNDDAHGYGDYNVVQL